MKPYVVLVTGSRTWLDPSQVTAALHQIASVQPEGFVVRHGDCPNGPDAIAKQWARRYAVCGVTEDPHPPETDLFGVSAFTVRDQQMVNLGADLCLAFIHRCVKPNCKIKKLHGSHGASLTAKLAEEAGIPTRRWTDLSQPA